MEKRHSASRELCNVSRHPGENAAVTIVKNQFADAYVRRPRKEIQFYLVHGADQGLIHERTSALVKSILGDQESTFSLTRIDGESIVREPGRLAEEAYAAPMLCDDRVLWIDARSRDLTKAIEPLMAEPPRNCWLVVESSNLKKSSRLRSVFERADNAICVECYLDDTRALAALIDAEATSAGIEISGDARDYLLSLLGADRLTTRSELAKLMLYSKGERRIDLTDITAIITDCAPSGLSELIDRTMLGQFAQVDGSAGRFFGDGGDPAVLMMRLASQMSFLHSLKLEVETADSSETVLQKHLVRFPPPSRAALSRQVERWSLASLEKTLPAVQKATARVRGDAKLGRLLVLRALWGLASVSLTNRVN